MPDRILVLCCYFLAIPCWSLTFSAPPWKVFAGSSPYGFVAYLAAYWILPFLIVLAMAFRSIAALSLILLNVGAMLADLLLGGLEVHRVWLKAGVTVLTVAMTAVVLDRNALFPLISRGNRHWRKHRRVAGNVDAKIEIASVSLDGMVQDASLSGLSFFVGEDQVRTRKLLLSPGQVARVSFGRGQSRVEIVCDVKWQRSQGGLRQIGLATDDATNAGKLINALSVDHTQAPVVNRIDRVLALTSVRRAALVLWLMSVGGSFIVPACGAQDDVVDNRSAGTQAPSPVEEATSEASSGADAKPKQARVELALQVVTSDGMPVSEMASNAKAELRCKDGYDESFSGSPFAPMVGAESCTLGLAGFAMNDGEFFEASRSDALVFKGDRGGRMFAQFAGPVPSPMPIRTTVAVWVSRRMAFDALAVSKGRVRAVRTFGRAVPQLQLVAFDPEAGTATWECLVPATGETLQDAECLGDAMATLEVASIRKSTLPTTMDEVVGLEWKMANELAAIWLPPGTAGVKNGGIKVTFPKSGDTLVVLGANESYMAVVVPFMSEAVRLAGEANGIGTGAALLGLQDGQKLPILKDGRFEFPRGQEAGSPFETRVVQSSDGIVCTVHPTSGKARLPASSSLSATCSEREGAGTRLLTFVAGDSFAGASTNVGIEVTSRREIQIVLSSYEPVQWSLHGSGVKNVKKVIVNGHGRQSIAGIEASLVESYVVETEGQSLGGFPTAWPSEAAVDLQAKIEKLTGLRVNEAHVVERNPSGPTSFSVTPDGRYYQPTPPKPQPPGPETPAPSPEAEAPRPTTGDGPVPVDGLASRYLGFNGAATAESVRSQDELLGNGSFSLSFWFEVPSIVPGMGILGTGSHEREGVGFWLGESGLIAGFNGKTRQLVSSSLSSGRWHFVAFVAKREGDGYRLLLYVDGQMQDQDSATAPLLGGPSHLKIGRLPYAEHAFAGKLDALAIWNEPLAAGDVHALWKGGASGATGRLIALRNVPAPSLQRNQNSMVFETVYAMRSQRALSEIVGSTEMSLAVWLKPEGENPSGVVMETGDQSLSLAVVEGRLAVKVAGAEFATAPLVLDAWQRVVLAIGSASRAALYIDGQVVHAGTVGDWASATSLFLGKISRGAGFTGKLDELQLWKKGLAASEVEALELDRAVTERSIETLPRPDEVAALWSFGDALRDDLEEVPCELHRDNAFLGLEMAAARATVGDLRSYDVPGARSGLSPVLEGLSIVGRALARDSQLDPKIKPLPGSLQEVPVFSMPPQASRLVCGDKECFP